MNIIKLGFAAAVVAVLASLASVLAVVPASADVSITFDELVFGAPGSVVEVERVEVDAELVGKACRLAVLAENQASVHIGNDLIVSTGGSQAVIVGVEDTPNGGTNQTYDMVLGPQIIVHIRFGQDGMSSLGFALSFECLEPSTTTEAPAPPPGLGQQVVESTTTTTALVESPVPAPTVPVVTSTAPPTTVPTTVTTVPATAAPTVAGAAANNLPQTPAAQAVPGSPAYTG